jgi:hypothetical protein
MYPSYAAEADGGPMFKPIERGSQMFIQLFDEEGQAYHKPVWVEINGHAINVFNGQRDPNCAIRFDLRETRLMAAVRGQPRTVIDTAAPVLAVVSRYFIDEKTGDCCFFFQTQNEAEKQEWIKVFFFFFFFFLAFFKFLEGFPH